MDNLTLLPRPRFINFDEGYHVLRSNQRIVLQADLAAPLLGAARRLQAALLERADLQWEIAATPAGPQDEVGVVLRLASDGAEHEQGYLLSIEPERVTIEARTPVGIFYGVCTLVQIVEQAGRRLPCLRIGDSPDYPVRGVMLDVSRDKVPTMATVYELVDLLAGWKINQLQLYTEHTFAFRNHPTVWASASPFTGEEILELDAFCRERHVELVPNQNSFGHMHRWLIHERYAGLAETHEVFNTPWGITMQGPFSLCPGDPGSLELVRSMFDELLPHFSSRLFNVGCDETIDLGQGRSREAVAERGEGRVYLDYLLKVYEEVKARGRIMQFWGDIIVQHPDLIPELPKDVIALEWGYEADHPFATNSPQYAASGLQFYVCPGTSSWNSLAGRTENAIGNLLNAAAAGLDNGATGYLITDWGDRGHWQMLPISFLGFAAGAAYAWGLETNRELDVAQAVSLHAFSDRSGSMGRVAFDLGNVYRTLDPTLHNSSVLFWVLQLSFEELRQRPWWGKDSTIFDAALTAIDEAMRPLADARMERADASLIIREYELTARLMRHACRRGVLASSLDGQGQAETRQELDEDMQQIIREYQELWLARNRLGGLPDSVGRLRATRLDYKV